MASETAFIFHMCIMPCGKTIAIVPRLKSSDKVMVKYQGHDFQKMAVTGAFKFHKHCLFTEIVN